VPSRPAERCRRPCPRAGARRRCAPPCPSAEGIQGTTTAAPANRPARRSSSARWASVSG
jgi:hypothetical protein